ncbi:MAG: hypothetical protein IPP64_06105 [Bacteroidetes bacterium]|nr:hypothetical protein [Bacteroidota bacterium]
MEKEDLINFILVFNVNAEKTELEKLSIEALKMIQVNIEIEIMKKNYKASN